ncbi:GNAT family N-acetyltransferase [bacterium]|nr:GNAT family N-acetyltransferase [bacterium]
MKDELRIRPIRRTDVPCFRELLDAVCRERRHLAFTEAPPLAEAYRYVTDLISRKDVQIVAVSGNEFAGWCDVTRLDLPGFGHCGRLGMGVAASFRGRGIGTALLKEALRRARENGLSRVELEVFASNEAAIRLYLKTGFVMEGRKIGARILDGNTDDVCLMALRLPDSGTAVRRKPAL